MADRDAAPDAVTLGLRIREARRNKELGLREVARHLDRTPSYISDIENDRRTPSEDVIRQLADELDLEFEELMALAGRLGSDADRYLRRRPAATTLFRRIYESDLSDAEIQKLVQRAEKLARERDRD
jgi:HTH-type transcriptional regulator, competence development regulator